MRGKAGSLKVIKKINIGVAGGPTDNQWLNRKAKVEQPKRSKVSMVSV